MTKEFIICSAIHFNDGNVYLHQPKNITSGIVVAGRRHSNCYATLQSIAKSFGIEEIAKNKVDSIGRESQGFLTNTNRYVNRKEAMKIAKEYNQLLNPRLHEGQDNELTSEDLYL